MTRQTKEGSRQLAFDTAVKVVKQRSTMGRQRTGHASNDPGLESRREHRVAGAQARGLEAGFADPPTSQSGPSGQWPVAHLAHGSPYRRPHHPRPRPHASMPHASRRLPFPRDPTPHPSLTTTQSSSLLLSLHLPSALALVFFTPIHIHPPQQWPFMKVQLAKLKADQEKSGKKGDHRENFKKVAAMWKDAPENPKNKAS
ncbi:hypothetical protein A1Q1_01779 [Trichosporon asahii var. asahii CBS 2479]|uniref:HMG box domain-containing protein n=1 Tax=Trichosporon asahii var. asahii (strain ATCC 90039 / CBS 2479 / JCM 2466 / KCTC 7840 / NBRC 103889/ NCYC 2677 / UAMH 7654) TaxID=1186058 RepID=J4UDE0_TRIAS|nr:hypothetical protein A1Q1_01779 [Trichosporon asahii var. asahii CBS 2479]EJT49130.1 hypothetical protein A1Q1_01779 [Trichosporon asahii var. asahii CBS 2479]